MVGLVYYCTKQLAMDLKVISIVKVFLLFQGALESKWPIVNVPWLMMALCQVDEVHSVLMMKV